MSDLSRKPAAKRGRAEQTLLHIKYVDDASAEQGATLVEGMVTGISLRVLARTEADGRTSVAASLYTRVHRMRASGKAFRYWKNDKLTSMARTKKGLVVLRDIDRRTGKTNSTHVFTRTDGIRLPEEAYEIRYWICGLSDRLQGWMRSNPDARRLEGPEPEGIHDEVETAIAAVRKHIGDIPRWGDRFPLLAHSHIGGPASTYLPFLDASDYAQVAKNLFGLRAYRRPLAREVERLPIQVSSWFALFRGLVPVDWIIEAMSAVPSTGQFRDYNVPMTALQRRGVRSILRSTPQPVLRRILKEPHHHARSSLRDAAECAATRVAATRDLSLLPAIIAARGQRRVRGSRDLEHLVRDLPEIQRWNHPRFLAAANTMDKEREALQEIEAYNRAIRLLPEGTAPAATWELWKDAGFRQRALDLIEARRLELMEARQREQFEREEARRRERIAREASRHQWALETAALLDGAEPAPGVRIVVARDAETLSRWGASLNNCIGGYARSLELDVFAAVLDAAGKVRLNLQITEARGVVQILGKNNRDAVRELGGTAQAVVDELVRLGVECRQDALGMHGLRVPQLVA